MYKQIINTIKLSVSDYEKKYNLSNMWKEPLVGIISAGDERIKILKTAVSDEHFMPFDIFPDAKSIVSFFIPFHESIVEGNIGGELASEAWAKAYVKTNDLIGEINSNISGLMGKNGYKAGKIPATHNFDAVKLISNWSHRHIACLAGLGTFGINNMLITKNGCCGRFGSIIINCELSGYFRTGGIKEKCLHKTNRNCGICQTRCTAGAWENDAYNRKLCYEQCLKNAEYHKEAGYADVCGKCLVGLPCSTREPGC